MTNTRLLLRDAVLSVVTLFAIGIEGAELFPLMLFIGVNVSGQIASVIAGGLILALVKAML